MSVQERWLTGLFVLGGAATVAAVLLLWIILTQPFAVAQALGSFQ
jgi:hypothetical protein